MFWKTLKEKITTVSAFASIIVFVIVAFEIMIMISPFAFFFYSVFNPIFDWLGQYQATRWLTSFFLPHMILPPTLFLKTIRIAGSVFFIIGAVLFIVCALQVYLGKLFKWGIADKGLYRYIRHPQYLALGIWGIGMAILWPRFIVLACLSIMFILYYFLAKDEERRMLKLYEKSYETYMSDKGMFLPKVVEAWFSFMNHVVPKTSLRSAIVSMVIVVIVIGSGFVLRTITLHSLPLESNANITIVSLLPEDISRDANAVNIILDGEREGKIALSADKDYLAYLMPADYIMQGMIANTGGEFHLYKQHNTIAMIVEWVLHPFEHLRASPALHMAKIHNVDPSIARRHHCPLGINDMSMDCNTCSYRRVIIDEVQNETGKRLSGSDLFSFGTIRTPRYAIDLNTDTGAIVNIVAVEKATAWANVPTPSI
ncbi:MAG TPA: isoprenylcysteine carboxylmethyltransferase family protein [Syntrophales bacterium]|nr:isoprenylcysteine carboxylmethyltransferase family protein [Syntrophales bacterium]